MKKSIHAGKLPESSMLIRLPNLVSNYYTRKVDPSNPLERVSFGTSGHRGSSLQGSFNEDHIVAITQAICLYRKANKIDGPLFLGMDTHALSVSAHTTALEVLAANEVEVMISAGTDYTPTPVISHAILKYNKGRSSGLADGILITPSHNPPQDGGFKYNPPHGGPADSLATTWIEDKANEILSSGLKEVRRVSHINALSLSSTHQYDYRTPYIKELGQCVDMSLIRDSGLKLGVDPLGGAGVHYWNLIAEYYKIDLSVLSEVVDESFRFMTVDTDGQIRMDPSSSDAMQGLLSQKDKFDLSFACDTDHDRHGIVTKKGLLPANHYLSVMSHYLFQHRPEWSSNARIGKTIVTTHLIERIASSLGREVFEVPVGFKWFVDGLLDSSLAFVGEESAGASFSRMNGSVWSTDKDGIIPCLLAGEIMARKEKDPASIYQELAEQFGEPVYDRIDSPATPEQKKALKKLSAEQVHSSELGGEKIESIQTEALGNKAPIGGLKVVTQSGWFAARPSGTEDIYKIYAESFKGREHLNLLLDEARELVNSVL